MNVADEAGRPTPETKRQEALTPAWVAPLFAALAVLLVPWIAYLRRTLPSKALSEHYNLSWVGFDVLLVLALARTAWLAFHHRRQVEIPASTTATLLIVDAWFDVTTAHSGWPLVESLLLAAFVELPLAALCIALTRRVEWLTNITTVAVDDEAAGRG